MVRQSIPEGLKEVSGRLKALLAEENSSQPLAPEKAARRKEELTAELAGLLAGLEPSALDEEALTAVGEALMHLRSDASVSSHLWKVKADLAAIGAPRKPSGETPATYTPGGLKVPADRPRLNKTF
jgi:hypothetical protein